MIRLPEGVDEAIRQAETVVVPTRQRAQAVRLAYAAAALERGAHVWRTPDVLPLDSWLAREIERCASAGERVPRLLTPAEEWLLWRECTAEHTRDLELIAPGPLASALREASRVALEFGIDVAAFSGRGALGREVQLLADVERSVRERARALGAASAAWLAPSLECLGRDTAVLFAGFRVVPAHVATVISKRELAGCRTRVGATGSLPMCTPRALLCEDPTDELERIALWCRERIEHDPSAHLLVLLPGASESREQLLMLVRQSLDPERTMLRQARDPGGAELADIEGGAPLSRAPLVAHALDSLAWLTGTAEFADVSAWLVAPYWTIPDAMRARLDLWLRERAGLELDPHTMLRLLEQTPPVLRPHADALAGNIRAALTALGNGHASPRSWSERIRSALTQLGWPGGRALSSDQEQTRARFTELLDDLGQLASVAPSISRGTAITWLREFAAQTAFRPASGDPAVTISPALTDPIVQYDGIWVAGLHADVWPEPVRAEPFLPLAAQIAAGVPAATAAARAADARALQERWMVATSELVLSAPARSGDVELSLSPMLTEYLVREPPSPFWLPASVHRAGMTETFEDASGVSWDATKELPGGTRCLELQNLCAFRAYAELRLGCTEMSVPEPGVAATLRGKLLHAALERFWNRIHSRQELLERSDSGLEALIAQCVAEAADSILGAPHPEGRHRAHERECRRTQRVIRLLCDLERERAPFAVRATEHRQSLSLGPATLNIRIDRIDELDGGGLAILDYKTGNPAPGRWYDERPGYPQLLAYLAAVGEQTVAMATVTVRANGIRFEGVALSENLIPGVRAVLAQPGEDPARAWSSRRREWLNCVERLAADFLEGRAVVDPRPGACTYCPVIAVCRIADRGSARAEVEGDD